MKQLLSYAKNIEKDFKTNNNDYNSKLELGISSLATGDYEKAKNMFDGAIELDSSQPSGWLAKAFAEIALVPDEKFNDLEIEELLNRALKSKKSEVLNYKVALAGCLAYRHAVLIKKGVLAVEKFLAEQKKAKQKKSAAIGTALVGSMLTGKKNSTMSNVIGGTMIAGGAAAAYQSSLKEEEFKKLADSLYAKSLSQTYLSIPIIYLCGTLIGNQKLKDENLKANFQVVIDSWKDSVIYLYGKQKDQLLEVLKKVNFSDADRIKKAIDDYKSIKEVGEFATFMKIIGLSKHKIFDSLDKTFRVELKNIFSSEEALEDLEKASKQQNKGTMLGAAALIIAFISIYIDDSVSDGPIPWIIDGIGGVLFWYFYYKKGQTTEMKDFQVIYNNLQEEIKNTIISKEDIDINLIQEKKQSGKKDSNLLDM